MILVPQHLQSKVIGCLAISTIVTLSIYCSVHTYKCVIYLLVSCGCKSYIQREVFLGRVSHAGIDLLHALYRLYYVVWKGQVHQRVSLANAIIKACIYSNIYIYIHITFRVPRALVFCQMFWNISSSNVGQNDVLRHTFRVTQFEW